ncbi:potassium channel family protein [Bacillus solimangrovi]|uniref:Potassium channel domain-containing protein n=1 Tax=Bacillus solimangrovi TaxID=1305675 RepID=A0A1E5LBG0_9BACI|nr:potassium channel family protein [Bacillus solimangrovi]OEH91408.1 hypothetical protein BFG57_05960 [Bacillus solimangrovi]
MVYSGILLLVLLILLASLRVLWGSQSQTKQYLTVENIFILFFTYIILLIGFGLVYMLLEMLGVEVLVDPTLSNTPSFISVLGSKLYFSAITLLSVGYGDLTPVGIGRIIAVVEALVGYVLPAAFVVRTVIDMEHHGEDSFKKDK